MSSGIGATANAPAPSVSALQLTGRSEQLWARSLAVLPALITVYLGFSAGGYYAGSVALVTLLLALVLIARILVADRPFAGVGRRYVIATGAFTLYTGWTLLSALWSHAEARAFTEVDRDLLYLLLLVLFGLLPRAAGLLRWTVRSTLVGALIVCGSGFITRVLPHLWPVHNSFASERLSYPITYWNALGLLASVGVLLALGTAAGPREWRPLRAVAAGTVPLFAATLLLTLSRGAIAALLIGVVIFVVVARTPSLLTTAVAIVPTTAIAVAVTYHATLLNSSHPRSPAAVIQGHHVALAVGLCIVAAIGLSAAGFPIETRIARRMEGRKLSRSRRRVAAAALVGTGAAAIVVAIAAGWPARLYNKFIQTGPVPASQVRLSSLSSDGRTPLWSAAWHAFKSQPLHGTGAGTYEFDWYRYRAPGSIVVVDAHNLYLQVLAELGIVGFTLLVITLVTILVALVARIPTGDRVLCAAAIAAVVAWCLHAAVDWDWQMPAVTAWVFMVGGAALAAQPSASQAMSDRETQWRVPMAVGLLIAAITPGLLLLSQDHLQRAATAFEAGNCNVAETQALASINDLSIRPEPYQIVGYCDIHQGRVLNAVAAMRQAVAKEPGNWQYHYGLAIADAYAGLNPRAALRATLRLNPSDPVIEPMLGALKTTSRDEWLAQARTAADTILVSGRLTLR